MLQQLRLYHWRNLKQARLDFYPGLNVLWGENGAGKTNCLEAIDYLCRARSFRGAHLKELISFKEDQFSIEAAFEKNNIAQRLAVIGNTESRKGRYNQSHVSHWQGVLPAVLWAPEDLSLVREGPKERRSFLDEHICQTDPLYTHNLHRYQRALKQRNHALKSNPKVAVSYTQELLRSASYLSAQRQRLIAPLNRLTSHFLEILGHSPELSIELDSETELGESPSQNLQAYEKSLAKVAHKEQLLKTTLVGPHRDELQIFHRKQLARNFSSEGQARALVAALRLSQWQLLLDAQEKPLLMIDEAGMSFDKGRWQQLWQFLETAPQVIVTTANPERLPPLKAHLTQVKNGQIFSSHS